MIRKVLSYTLYFLTVIFMVYSSLTYENYIYTIILIIISMIFPIKKIIEYIRKSYYSKIIKSLLELREEDYLFLAEHDIIYEALLIKMEKIIYLKNKNG